MFIKKITKPDRKGEITYTYYRLVHSYKVGNKNRQQTIINLGSLKGLDKKYHKLLADSTDSLLSGVNTIQFDTPGIVDELAEKFSKEIISKGVFPEKKKIRSISNDLPTEYQEVDTSSIEELESKSIGGEWLVKQAFDKLNLSQILADTNMSDKEIVIAQKLLTAKLIHPSSELETERWLEENSGANDIYGNKDDHHKTTRYRLYNAASHMYKHKEEIESNLYAMTQNIFSQRSKVVIYDLTNMYFEGQMQASHQKQLKEQSMEDKIKARFIESMDSLIDGLSKPRRMKKTTQVHEKVGRIKKQFAKIAHKYSVIYTEDVEKGIVTNIIYKEIENRKRPKGEYFLRYTKKLLSEKEIWGDYNLTRDVEAVFRCLKSDLDIRPIHHQKDAYIEPHIWLSIIAYQFVNFIKIGLAQNDINYSWSTIVNKMEAQRCSLQSMDTKNNGKMYTKLCTRPNPDIKNIFLSLGFKERPFVRK